MEFPRVPNKLFFRLKIEAMYISDNKSYMSLLLLFFDQFGQKAKKNEKEGARGYKGEKIRLIKNTNAHNKSYVECLVIPFLSFSTLLCACIHFNVDENYCRERNFSVAFL